MRLARNRKVAPLLVLALMAAVLVGFPLGDSPAAAATGSISGRVTVEGRVVPDLSVSVSSEDSQWQRFVSVVQGRYTVANVPDGRYRLSFGGPQPVAEEYWNDKPTWSSAQIVTISEGSVLSGMDADLGRESVLIGRVTGNQVGLPNVMVQIFPVSELAKDGFYMHATGTATTDSTGHYSIPRLTPGDYAVHFYADHAPGAWASEWSRGASKRLASRITVGSGTQVTVDAALEQLSTNEQAAPSLEKLVLEATNRYRASGATCGDGTRMPPVGPLKMDATLVRAARRQSMDMGRRGFFHHWTPDGVDPWHRIFASGFRPRFDGPHQLEPDGWKSSENLFAGGDGTPQAAVDGWIGSHVGHCETLMDAKWTHMGAGYAQADAGEWNTVWAQTFGKLPSIAPASPGPPERPTASSGRSQVTVAWLPTTSGSSPIEAYTVTAHPGGQTCVTSGDLACTVSGLTPGQAYSFTVTARNSAGVSAASPASATVGPTEGLPLSAPRQVSLMPGNSSVTVAWRPPQSDGGTAITKYEATAVPSGKSCTTTALSCRVSELNNDDPYAFHVRVTNAAGITAFSELTPTATPLDAPDPVDWVRISGHPTPNQAEVRWDYDGPLPAGTEYLVRVSAPNSTATYGSWESSVQRHYLLSELTPGAKYRVQVVVRNPGGRSSAEHVDFRQPASNDRRPPTAVRSLQAAPLHRPPRTRLSWREPRNRTVQGPLSYRVTVTGANVTHVSQTVRTSSMTIRRLKRGTRYRAKVVAVQWGLKSPPRTIRFRQR